MKNTAKGMSPERGEISQLQYKLEQEQDALNGESAVRILTVSTVHREYGRTRTKHSWVPALRVNGQWLGRLGFAPGQKVRLKMGQGTILITAPRGAVRARDEEEECLTRK